MATNEGSDILAADRNQFYQRFIALVVNPMIGSTGGSGVSYWYGNYPYNSFDGNLGPRAFSTSDPAPTAVPAITLGSEATNGQVAAILNAIHVLAGRLGRYRNTTYTYLRNPGPNTVGSASVTALNTGYNTTLTMPSQAAFAMGQPIQFNPHVDNFMDALRTQLVNFRASNPVSMGPYCHTSCHTSCHGARGRR